MYSTVYDYVRVHDYTDITQCQTVPWMNRILLTVIYIYSVYTITFLSVCISLWKDASWGGHRDLKKRFQTLNNFFIRSPLKSHSSRKTFHSQFLKWLISISCSINTLWKICVYPAPLILYYCWVLFSASYFSWKERNASWGCRVCVCVCVCRIFPTVLQDTVNGSTEFSLSRLTLCLRGVRVIIASAEACKH